MRVLGIKCFCLDYVVDLTYNLVVGLISIQVVYLVVVVYKLLGLDKAISSKWN